MAISEQQERLSRGYCPGKDGPVGHGLIKVSERVWWTGWLARRIFWRCFSCGMREEVDSGGLVWGSTAGR